MNNYYNRYWDELLPYTDFPFRGESLIGYLLRLDNLNGFNSGTIIKQALRKQINLNSKTIDIEHIEKNLDINFLCKKLNISENILMNHMIYNIRKRIYKYDNKHVKNFFKYGSLKVCPKCLENWRLPIMHFFDGLSVCLVHGAKLITHCTCGQNINFFNRKELYNCNNKSCNKAYSYLSKVMPTDSKYMEKNLFFNYVYDAFINDSISLVRYDEKILKGIKTRMFLLNEIKKEATKFIKMIIPANLFNGRTYYEYDDGPWTKGLDFNSIVHIMYEYRLLPFQFLNLKVPYKLEIKSKLIELYNCKFNQIETVNNYDGQFLHFGQTYKVIDSSFDKKNCSFFTSPIIQNFFIDTEFKGKIEVTCETITVIFDFIVACSKSSSMGFFIKDLHICMTYC